MEIKNDENHIISSDNVLKYIDDTSDGGYWYTVKDEIPKFVTITNKALQLLKYDSFEQLMESGETPHTLVHPILENQRDKEAYWEFIRGNRDRFYMDCSIKTRTGEEIYGELFIAHSLVFPHEKGTGLYRVMLHIFSPTEAIFRQSKLLLDEMSSGVIIVRAKDKDQYDLIYGNEGFCEVFKWDKQSLADQYGKNYLDYVYNVDQDSVLETMNESLESGESTKNTYRLLDSMGKPVWIKAEHKKIQMGSRVLIYINFLNITDLMDVQREMEKANERLSSFLNHTPAGIVVFEKINGTYLIKEINSTFIDTLNGVAKKYNQTYELEGKDQFMKMNIEDIKRFVDPIDLPLVNQLILTAEKKSQAECNFRLNIGGETKDAVWIHCRAIARRRTNGNMQIIAVYQDITNQIKAEMDLTNKQAKIINLSYHDALTDVLNRQSYNEFIKNRGASLFKNTGVAFVDLNGLKVINDTYGHSKGDDAIKLAVLLIEHYFEKDEIYRISGDNFVIIKENIEQSLFYGRIGKLIGEFNKYEIASIGYNWDDRVSNISHNVDKAEAAMRIAKQDYYTKHAEDVSKNRPAQLDELRRDIEEGKYVMYLQPKAYTRNTKVVAAESLIRRIDKDGKVMAPITFVPALEKEHLVNHLDFFMLEETCKTLHRWDDEKREKIKISVNMSRVTLAEPDYINKVLRIVDRYNVDHKQIEFEITESTETMDRHALEEIAVQLADLDFGVSLDDMGTEYSSVMMLTMQGLDTVKIDRGFILQMDSRKGQVLVEHIIRMCHDLGELCIAEGVEDDETRMLLNSMGCDMYQGYLLAKPLPVNEFEKLLDSDTIAL